MRTKRVEGLKPKLIVFTEIKNIFFIQKLKGC